MMQLEKLTALKAFLVFFPPFLFFQSLVSCPLALVSLPCTAVLCTITLYSPESVTKYTV